MHFKTIVLSIAALLMASTAFAGHGTTPANETSKIESQAHLKCLHGAKFSKHAHHTGFVKPGAAISMTHDYDGETPAGEFETVTLTLNHIYDNGFLSIELLPSSELQVFANLSSEKIELTTGSVLDLPIQISGIRNGTYSVAIETIYISPQGHESRRVLSVPITIGRKPAGKVQPIAPQISKSKPTGFIALPADEVIR